MVDLQWLYDRQALGIKLGLPKVERFLEKLGNPHHDFSSIHIAGTNGKGSVAQFIQAALTRSGHKTGLTTSPHLVRFHERIQIDGEAIDDEVLAALLEEVQPLVAEMDAEGDPPTFFEVTTALAFLHFARAGVDWAVVECGLGGRLDATNLTRPALTVITNVSLDHQQWLGSSIGEIAAEKAGIMKPGVPLVTAARDDALLVLKARSRELEVPMSVVGEDYVAVPDLNGMRLLHPGGDAHYDLAARGEYQIENAAVAVAALDALRVGGVNVAASAVQTALAATIVPGRLELCQYEGMEVLLDAAHNAAGAHALRRYLGHADWTRFHLIVAFSKDKDWEEMLAQWAPLAAHVWAVPLRNTRGLEPEALRPAVAGIGIPFEVADDVAGALQGARQAGARRALVAGSVFLVGDARAVLRGNEMEAAVDQ